MNWLDFVLGFILVVSVATSFRKGLSRELIGLVSVVLALLLGTWFYGAAGSFLLPYVSSVTVANFAGFFMVFTGVMLLGTLVSFAAGKFLKITGLSIIDHALGAGFGVLRATVVSIALIMGIMAFSQGDKAPVAVVDSRLAPYVVDAARLFAAMAPYDLKQGFWKSYEQVKQAWGTTLEKGLRSVPNGVKKKHERAI